MKYIPALSVITLALTASFAHAMEPEYYVGGKASTLGLGVEAGAKLTPAWGVRLNGNFLNLSDTVETSDVNYDADVELRSVGALADWYPMDNGFHLTAGVYYNGNEASVLGTANRNVSIGGTTYTPAQLGTLNGNIEANQIAPYLGIGYQEKITESFSLGMELGVMYTGRYEASLTSNSPLVSQADLAAEERELNDEIDSIRVWPMLGIRAGYHF